MKMTPLRDVNWERSSWAKSAGEWLAVVIAWSAVLMMLLAIVGAMLGEPN